MSDTVTHYEEELHGTPERLASEAKGEGELKTTLGELPSLALEHLALDPAGSPPQRSSRPIVCAVDDTIASEHTVKWLLREWVRPRDRIHLVHVLERPRPLVFNALGVPEVAPAMDVGDEALGDDLSRDARDRLMERFGAIIQEAGVEFRLDIVLFTTDAASVGEVLVSLANQLDAAVIVMASHGKGRLKEFVLGSSTVYVCRHSKKIPVVVVPEAAVAAESDRE